MKTDDFLADLELQLRDAVTARPRRRPAWRPLARIAVVAAVAAALVAGVVVGAGELDERSVPATGGTRVVVENRTGVRAAGRQVAKGLERLGYAVTLRRRAAVADTTVWGGSKRDERRIAQFLQMPDADGWTGYAPLGHGVPAITVVLGRDLVRGGKDLEPLRP